MCLAFCVVAVFSHSLQRRSLPLHPSADSAKVMTEFDCLSIVLICFAVAERDLP